MAVGRGSTGLCTIYDIRRQSRQQCEAKGLNMHGRRRGCDYVGVCSNTREGAKWICRVSSMQAIIPMRVTGSDSGDYSPMYDNYLLDEDIAVT